MMDLHEIQFWIKSFILLSRCFDSDVNFWILFFYKFSQKNVRSIIETLEFELLK